MSLGSAFCSVRPHSEKPLAIPDSPSVAAKWLQLFQPSHPQASPSGKERNSSCASSHAKGFLCSIGPDWVSWDVFTNSNQTAPTSGAESGVISTKTKGWEWEVGSYHWQERTWGVDVGRTRPDLSRNNEARGLRPELIRPAGTCPGLLGGRRQEARGSCPRSGVLECPTGVTPSVFTGVRLEWGSVGVSRKHFTCHGMAGMSVEAT